MTNPYTLYKEGSTWSKWDLHVHTPGTMLNDCYKTDDDSDVWDKFITEIENSDIDVIGITDYFSISNYEVFMQKHKTKYPESKKIFFPNIEFRLDVSVNKDADQVDIHVIFDNQVSIGEIKDFLLFLPSNVPQNNTYISCGHLTKQQIEKAAIKSDELLGCLNKSFGSRMCYLIGAAATNQGLRPDTNSLRKINISENIERHCDFIFGNNKSKEYYLKTDRYENGEASKPKPVIACSDAHSFDDLNNKLGDGNYFTWIKAIPIFNGLRQIIFEPDDRVLIQEVEPDYKESHNIIASIKITDETNNFGNQEIIFNKNLNTIIGGKSSGKSLLLYFLADSIDSEQIRKLKEKFTEFEGYSFEGSSFNVKWADGIIDSNADAFWDDEDGKIKHKITYIPQLYINYLAERKGKEQLNQLIDEILLQNSGFKVFKDDFDNKIRELNMMLESSLASLLALRDDWYETTEERKKYATQETYESQIKQLTEQYSKLNTITVLSGQELEEYKKLIAEKNELEGKIANLSNNKLYISNIRNEIVQSAINLIGDSSKKIIGSLNKHFAKINSEETNTKRIVDIVTEGFKIILSNFDKEYSVSANESLVSLHREKLVEIAAKLKIFDDRLAKKSELGEILQNIEKIKADKKHIIELDHRISSYHNDYYTIKKSIVEMLNGRIEIYSSLEKHINTTFNDMGLGISLSCNIYYPLGSFKLYETLNRQFSFESKYLKDLFDERSKLLNYNDIPAFFQNLYRTEGNIMYFSDKSTHQLKIPATLDTIYHYLIQDNFSINYDVTYNGDNLIKMSPGKKGTVLLILFLELSSSENPIIIDQPEDNLDNRTVYDLLGKMIKSKKKKRQIIIVTHNANLVVNTDAENVIVANQEGQDPSVVSEVKRTKFEYINGPIELSFRNPSSKNILAGMGIKQHICDILEGGDEAFKLREQKYRE